MLENKFEFSNNKPEEEKELGAEEREQLKGEMTEYAKGLRVRIEEIKVEIEATKNEGGKELLNAELSDLEEQAAGLDEFGDDIDEAESITIKPFKD